MKFLFVLFLYMLFREMEEELKIEIMLCKLATKVVSIEQEHVMKIGINSLIAHYYAVLNIQRQ